MRNFSLTELSNRSGEVVEAAYTGPIAITRRGKRKFVLMTAEQYEKLTKTDNPHRVFGSGETPSELSDLFASDLENTIKGEGYDN